MRAKREPMQFRGPSPNGKNVYGFMEPLFASENLSGSNFSGFGKCSGSWWIA